MNSPASSSLDAQITLTKMVADVLVQSSIDLLTEKFGVDYAKKNPHLLSNVINMHRSVYLTLQKTHPAGQEAITLDRTVVPPSPVFE